MDLARIPAVSQLIDLALEEDLGRGDATSFAVNAGAQTLVASIRAREDLVLAGLGVAAEVFRRVDPSLELEIHEADGAALAAGAAAMTIRGNAAGVLMAERTALNFLQRLCGVATAAGRYVEAVAGTKARIVDTRKTTPGYRVLEKAAVRAGGAHNHRADLGSGILIKDNHIAACGSVRAAIESARARAVHGLRIEVEVDTTDQLVEALDAGAEVVLLDNFTPAQVEVAARSAHERDVLVECSGGITLATVGDYARAGADIISVGALTHSSPAVDLGLDAVPG